MILDHVMMFASSKRFMLFSQQHKLLLTCPCVGTMRIG